MVILRTHGYFSGTGTAGIYACVQAQLMGLYTQHPQGLCGPSLAHLTVWPLLHRQTTFNYGEMLRFYNHTIVLDRQYLKSEGFGLDLPYLI